MNRNIFLSAKILIFVFIYLFFQEDVYAFSGGFVVHKIKQNLVKVNINKTHPTLTPLKMKDLYSTELYKSFYDVLKLKGFNEYDIPRLFCVAKMESDFNPVARNLNKNGSVDLGLFQINSSWQTRQSICRMRLHDVEANIDCAKRVLAVQGLTAWVTYKKYGLICEKSLKI